MKRVTSVFTILAMIGAVALLCFCPLGMAHAQAGLSKAHACCPGMDADSCAQGELSFLSQAAKESDVVPAGPAVLGPALAPALNPAPVLAGPQVSLPAPRGFPPDLYLRHKALLI